MANIEINGRKIEAEAGQMVIQAADEVGIYIPRFCYHPKLSIAANCRMCLVEVENAPKPMPACSTPVTDGMKVFTASALAQDAQRGTMEFLLINHPLDCPVCDQGGECPLQDQAVGYGKDISRFTESKRVVNDKDIGPLIATEMTRCIHCTRCVRFGQEIAGVMELGAAGRGEHTQIGTYIGCTVDSELSGNMIDLCPVGALTSKPYRFAARAWELVSSDGVAPHDCIGSNLVFHSLRNVVQRVLPRDNPSINECWLSDRDRFSYQSLHSKDRLLAPKLRDGDKFIETDWETALRYTAQGLQLVLDQHGPHQLAALVSPTATLEEFYLVQKLMRSLGSHNIDHRLRQTDFRDDDIAPMAPSLGSRIEQLEQSKAILLVGANVRKDQPLLGLRVRKAFLNGAAVMAINSMDYPFHFDLAEKSIVPPQHIPHVLACVAAAVMDGASLPPGVQDWLNGDPPAVVRVMAERLLQAGADAHILLGLAAIAHPQFSVLRALAQAINQRTGARFGLLPEANSVAGWLAGCLPHRGPLGSAVDGEGLPTDAMLNEPRKGYLLVGAEPELDCLESQAANNAMAAAEFVVRISAFDLMADAQADVLLPMAPFSESAGTRVNCELQAQRCTGAVVPKGEARPAWKILRVLGNLMDRRGFDYVSLDEVRGELDWDDKHVPLPAVASWRLSAPPALVESRDIDLQRITDVSMYSVDPYVRRAPALQATADAGVTRAYMGADQARKLSLQDGERVNAHTGETSVELNLGIDDRVPTGCVYIPSGVGQTSSLRGVGIVRIVR